MMQQISIITIIFCTLGLPFTKWHCIYNDEFSYLSVGQNVHNVKDLGQFFINGDCRSAFAENKNREHWHHLDIFYRPICSIAATIQHWAFGLEPYGYHLSNMTLHGINSALLFTLVSSVTTQATGFLAALYFGFHPIIAGDMHHIDYFHIFLSLFFVLLVGLFLLRFCNTRSLVWYACALGAYALALLTRETALGALPIIFGGLWLWDKRSCPLIRTLPFIFIACCYIALRFTMYPQNGGAVTSTLIECIRARFSLRLLTIIYDGLGMPWLLYTSSAIRLSILMLSTCAILCLFIRNTHKLLCIFFACSALALLWPCFTVAGYTQRYLYEALPFIIGGFIVLFTAIKHKKKLAACLSIVIAYNAYTCVTSFKTYEAKAHQTAQLVHKLVNHSDITGRAVLVIGRPSDTLFGNHIFLRIFDLYRKDIASVFEIEKTDTECISTFKKFNRVMFVWDNEKREFTTKV